MRVSRVSGVQSVAVLLALLRSAKQHGPVLTAYTSGGG